MTDPKFPERTPRRLALAMHLYRAARAALVVVPVLTGGCTKNPSDARPNLNTQSQIEPKPSAHQKREDQVFDPSSPGGLPPSEQEYDESLLGAWTVSQNGKSYEIYLLKDGCGVTLEKKPLQFKWYTKAGILNIQIIGNETRWVQHQYAPKDRPPPDYSRRIELSKNPQGFDKDWIRFEDFYEREPESKSKASPS